MTEPSEATPPRVPETAKPGGDVLSRWGWTERAAWTERMLTALEQGVKGGVWFSLIDKVYAPANLAAAAAQVVANRGAPGVDHVTVERFTAHAEENLGRLGEQLRQGYRPQPIRRVYIP